MLLAVGVGKGGLFVGYVLGGEVGSEWFLCFTLISMGVYLVAAKTALVKNDKSDSAMIKVATTIIDMLSPAGGSKWDPLELVLPKKLFPNHIIDLGGRGFVCAEKCCLGGKGFVCAEKC